MKKKMYKAAAIVLAAAVLTAVPVHAAEGVWLETEIEETAAKENGTDQDAADTQVQDTESPGNGYRADPSDENAAASDIYHGDEEVVNDEKGASESAVSCGVPGCSGDGLEGGIRDVTNLPSSEENNCQLTISADLPEGFDANVFVQLKNYSTGSIYQYTLYAVNSFVQRGYVPEGEYRVLECSIYDDINGTFPFLIPEDFEMKYGEVKALTLSLKDREGAKKEIERRLKDGLDIKLDSANFSFTKSNFDVKFNGTGNGRVAVTGSQNSALKIFIKIVRPGLPGDMTADISFDDGMTFPLKDVEVPYSGTVDLEGTGLTLIFEVPVYEADGDRACGHFDRGDTFRSVIHDPKSGVEYSGKYKSRAKLEIIDEDPDVSIYDQMVRYNLKKVEVDVIKGGEPGEAVIKYSLDGKYFSDEMLVPYSGKWPIDGTTLSISFYAQAGDLVFETGDSYIAELFKETRNGWMGFLLAIALLYGAGALAVWYYFRKQIVPEDVYTIRIYTPVMERTGRKS